MRIHTVSNVVDPVEDTLAWVITYYIASPIEQRLLHLNPTAGALRARQSEARVAECYLHRLSAPSCNDGTASSRVQPNLHRSSV